VKIEILGENKDLVSSASVSELALGLVYVINATEKQSYFHRQGSSFLLFLSDEYKDKNPIHEAFVVYNADKDDNRTAECEVVFVAENEHEESLMRCGVSYAQVDRGQYVSITVKDELEKNISMLASVSNQDGLSL